MPSPSPDTFHAPSRYGVLAWLAAALAGVVCGVTLALLGPFGDRLPVFAALVSVGCGAVVTILLAPWRRVIAWSRHRRDLEALAERLRQALADAPAPAEQRRWRGESAQLPAVVDELLREVAESRQTARRLHRRMGESIRRETHRQTVRLKREAHTDPLTGLTNRRGLDLKLESLQQERRTMGTVVAMAVDLDLFKQVNDCLGHDTGDECLRFLGELLRSSVRREDCAVRLGGDEFIVLMPNQTVAGARAMAERLCCLFRQMPWPHEHVARPSLSVGLASCSFPELEDGRQLIRSADEALYRAKRAGRARASLRERAKKKKEFTTEARRATEGHRESNGF